MLEGIEAGLAAPGALALTSVGAHGPLEGPVRACQVPLPCQPVGQHLVASLQHAVGAAISAAAVEAAADAEVGHHAGPGSAPQLLFFTNMFQQRNIFLTTLFR